MILACALDPDGKEMCVVFASGYVSSTMKECVDDLILGSEFVEKNGWEIRSFECYDWIKKKGTAL